MAFSKAVIIVFVTAISIVFVTGGFNVTQAQEEEQGQQTPHSSSAPPALPLPTSPSPSPASPITTAVSPKEKLQMCDPNKPKLKFVNTTESNVCGLPKSIKAPEVLPPPATTTSLPRSISSLSQRPIIPP
jgi:hypothetical protein